MIQKEYDNRIFKVPQLPYNVTEYVLRSEQFTRPTRHKLEGNQWDSLRHWNDLRLFSNKFNRIKGLVLDKKVEFDSLLSYIGSINNKKNTFPEDIPTEALWRLPTIKFWTTFEIIKSSVFYHDLMPLDINFLKQKGQIHLEIGTKEITLPVQFQWKSRFVVCVVGEVKVELFPPEEWENLYIYPYIHSRKNLGQVDLGNPDSIFNLQKLIKYEVVLNSKDVIYLPPMWMYRISYFNPSILVHLHSDSPEAKSFKLEQIYLDLSIMDSMDLKLKAVFSVCLSEELFQLMAIDIAHIKHIISNRATNIKKTLNCPDPTKLPKEYKSQISKIMRKLETWNQFSIDKRIILVTNYLEVMFHHALGDNVSLFHCL